MIRFTNSILSRWCTTDGTTYALDFYRVSWCRRCKQNDCSLVDWCFRTASAHINMPFSLQRKTRHTKWNPSPLKALYSHWQNKNGRKVNQLSCLHCELPTFGNTSAARGIIACTRNQSTAKQQRRAVGRASGGDSYPFSPCKQLWYVWHNVMA